MKKKISIHLMQTTIKNKKILINTKKFSQIKVIQMVLKDKAAIFIINKSKRKIRKK